MLDALTSHGSKIRRITPTSAVAQCPAHDDGRPSLSIGHKDGKTLIYCFAGCTDTDITNALQLTTTDLFDEPATTATVVDLDRYRFNPEQTTPETQTPVVDPMERLEWVYVDADWEPYVKVTKTRLPDGSKTFRQAHWNGQQWINGLGNIEPVLYELPAVLATATDGGIIVICEGEKDADTFNTTCQDGRLATTAPMGAGKWRDTYTDTLQGAARVDIIHDNDDPGIKHATRIIEHLDTAGIPWRILTPAKGKDLTDHINAGLTLDDLIDDQQRINEAKQAATDKALARAIEEERIKQTARDTIRKEITETNAANRYALPIFTKTLTEELEQPDEETHYIIDKLWPNGANVSLTASFKAGKTSTINNVIRSLVDGLPLFGQFATNHQDRIAYLNYEVAPNQMRRWIREINIRNTDAITLLNMRGHTWPFVSDYVIKQTIELLATHNIHTLILDPLARAFVGSGDENSNQDVGIFLDTLDYIKDQAGVANLLIAAHTGRNAEQGNSRARGASRFDDWVDARWMLTKDADGQRWFEADGRDVSIDESRLDWEEDTRQQIINIEVTRKDHANESKRQAVIKLLAEHPDGLTGYEMGVKYGIVGTRDTDPQWLTEMTNPDGQLWNIGLSKKGRKIYVLRPSNKTTPELPTSTPVQE